MKGRMIYTNEHELFRDNVRRFFHAELEPNIGRWEAEQMVPRELWLKAGKLGLLCCAVPEDYGGPGVDFSYNMIVAEEIGYAIGGASLGFSMHSDIVTYYLLNHASEEIKQKWLPKMVTGEVISALGMTEPGAGSDVKEIRTTAVRDGTEYVINGQKTFITNGQTCDFVVLACKTDPGKGAKGISMFLVEAARDGFERGRNLEKIGQKAADTSELFVNDVRVPAGNLIGAENKGFAVMMGELPRERLTLSYRALAEAQRAFDLAVEYVKERKAFGKTLLEFQNTQFKLAEMKTSLAVGWSFLDQCLNKSLAGELSPEEGAMAKLWSTETEGTIIDECLQLFGGYGYMREYPISRLFVDARVRRIYGGTSEIMKLIIGRSL